MKQFTNAQEFFEQLMGKEYEFNVEKRGASTQTHHEIKLKDAFIAQVKHLTLFQMKTYWRAMMIWLIIAVGVWVIGFLLYSSNHNPHPYFGSSLLAIITILISTFFVGKTDNTIRKEVFLRRKKIAKSILETVLPKWLDESKIRLTNFKEQKTAVIDCTNYRAYLSLNEPPNPLLLYLDEELLRKYWGNDYSITRLTSLDDAIEEENKYQSKLKTITEYLQDIAGYVHLM